MNESVDSKNEVSADGVSENAAVENEAQDSGAENESPIQVINQISPVIEVHPEKKGLKECCLICFGPALVAGFFAWFIGSQNEKFSKEQAERQAEFSEEQAGRQAKSDQAMVELQAGFERSHLKEVQVFELSKRLRREAYEKLMHAREVIGRPQLKEEELTEAALNWLRHERAFAIDFLKNNEAFLKDDPEAQQKFEEALTEGSPEVLAVLRYYQGRRYGAKYGDDDYFADNYTYDYGEYADDDYFADNYTYDYSDDAKEDQETLDQKELPQNKSEND